MIDIKIGETKDSGVFQPIALAALKGESWRRAFRLNCQGSLYYFIKFALKKRRFTDSLHKPICDMLLYEHIKMLIEMPRDHFKSTICSEGLPMWRVLWCSDEDLNEFRKLGYSEEFISFMQRIHRPEARNLLVSENITNSGKLGRRIDFHYESNAIYRHLFPELIPTSSETWSNISKWQRLPTSKKALGGHGEGTFDFLGVGGALQSRHYNGIVVEDDLVGRKAIESISVMEKTVEYHRLLVGAFENESNIEENDELVVGNRWAYNDLNSWIRENEPWFEIHSHGAMGGCCDSHQANTPIFPEEFSKEKLEKIRRREGSYHYSCQYLNDPAAPENADFHEEDLRYFNLVQEKDNWLIRFELTKEEKDSGITKKDIQYRSISKCIVTDPNHSGAQGRCRHSINVVGLTPDGDFIHLDCWAAAVNTETYLAKLYEMCDDWDLTRLGIETVAAQKYLAFHINFRNRLEGRSLRLIELKGEVDAPDGSITRNKEFRIRNVLSPIFESHHFYTQRRFMDFRGEYTTFPKGRFCDILDGLAYVPQMLRLPQSWIEQQKWKQHNAAMARKINQPYCVEVR